MRRVSLRPNVAGSESACHAERTFHRLHDLQTYFRKRVQSTNFIVEDIADQGCVTKDAPRDGQADWNVDELGLRKAHFGRIRGSSGFGLQTANYDCGQTREFLARLPQYLLSQSIIF
jgi:hypothetical protein